MLATFALLSAIFLSAIFYKENDVSARYWIAGSISTAIGLTIIIFRPTMPVFVGYSVANFFAFYANILFAYSCEGLASKRVNRQYRYELILAAYCGLFTLAASFGYNHIIPFIAIGAAVYTNGWAARAANKANMRLNNSFMKMLFWLFFITVALWMVRAVLAFLNQDIDLLTELNFTNAIFLSLILAISCLRQIVYIVMRTTEQGNSVIQLTENIPIGTFIIEIDNKNIPKFIFVSKRFLEITGFTKALIFADYSLLLHSIHPEDRFRFSSALGEAYEKQEKFSWEGRAIFNEKNYWIRIESNVSRATKDTQFRHGVLIDISDQKQAEKELGILQQESQKILEELPIPLIWSSLKENGITLFVNTQFTEVFGYTLSDIPRTEDWMIRAYPDRSYRSVVLAWWRTKVAQAIKYKSQIPSRELKMLTKDGQMLDVLMGATIVEGLLSVSFLDITDRKKAEGLALTLTENIPIGIYVMEVKADGSSRLSFLSKRFIQQFGLQNVTIKANPNQVFEKIHAEDYEDFITNYSKAILEKKRFYHEARVVIRNKEYWFSFEAIPRVASDDLLIWEGVTADITSRKEAEKIATQQVIDIALAEKKLIRLEEVDKLNNSLKKTIQEKNLLLKSSTTVFKANSMGNMMRSVAHEINNPLGAISLNTELLGIELKSIVERLSEAEFKKIEDLVGAILSDSERAGSVVNRLRKLFVYGEDSYSTFNLSELMQETVAILAEELNLQLIELHTLIEPDCEMLGDNGQIQMVILNALNNAIYALKEQSGPKQIYLRLNKNVNEIQIECQDSGPGFPVDFIKKGPGLFQTSKKEGMGVGLWLSKTIIENHHGTLRVENHQKGGALLCIRLPIFNPLQNNYRNEN